MVRHDMATAAKLRITIVLIQIRAHFPPVTRLDADVSNISDEAAHKVVPEEPLVPVKQTRKAAFCKCVCFQRAEKRRGFQRDAIVRNAGRGANEMRRALRVAGTHHRKRVHEDLRADLLGEHFTVSRGAAALRRGNAALEV